MILISNEGNITGPNRATEGTVKSVATALDLDYDCKIFVKEISGKIYLASREPFERVSLNFLVPNRDRLWIHCGSIRTLRYFSENLRDHQFNFFFDAEDCSITSKGFVWWWPSTLVSTKTPGIIHLPEVSRLGLSDLVGVGGVCSDYIGAMSV